jgi:hypothetical protein
MHLYVITVKKPAETQTSNRLASYLVRVPNSRSGRHEFESPVLQKLDLLTKKWKDPSGQVFLHHCMCNAQIVHVQRYTFSIVM